MKRSQNLEMVDGHERNDMEEMEHEGENENHVLTTMENNPNHKAKEEKYQVDVDRSYGNSWSFNKNFFEFNLEKCLSKYIWF